MNINRISKFLILFLILMMTLTTTLTTKVSAVSGDYTSPNQFDSYNTAGTSWNVVDKGIDKTLGVALSIMRTVAFCFALLMLIVIGIKYLIAVPQVKAELKHDVPTYIVGAVILFGAAGILQLITHFVNDTL